MLALPLTRRMLTGAFVGVLSTMLLLTASACSDRPGESTLASITDFGAMFADSMRGEGYGPSDTSDLGPEGGGIPTVIDSVIEDTGRVILSVVQGGCWTIETPVAPFSPVNLPAELRIDGIEVAFKGTVTQPLAGCGIYPGLSLEWIHSMGTNP